MPHLRKRIFVDSEVQGALVRRVIAHWAAFAATLAVILGAVQFFANPLASFDEHLALFPRRHGLTFITLVLLLPAFLWDTARLSHRFSGPVQGEGVTGIAVVFLHGKQVSVTVSSRRGSAKLSLSRL